MGAANFAGNLSGVAANYWNWRHLRGIMVDSKQLPCNSARAVSSARMVGLQTGLKLGAMIGRAQTCCKPSPRGFTVVELLVAITVVGILLALLLPAVQAARTSARRLQCANNLKQVGLALNNYHGQRGALPAGYLSGTSSSGADTGPGWGWLAQTLPYLEQTPLWNSIDFRQPIESPANTASQQLVQSLLCSANVIARPTWPAETRDANGYPMSQICRVSFCAYVGMYGSTDAAPAGDGVFFRNSRICFKHISDGSSKTIAAGERAYKLGNGTWTGAVTGASMYPDGYDGQFAAKVLKPAFAMVLGHTGAGNGPNSRQSEINQFYSLHGDGVNFVFVDGHVMFLSANVDYALYQSMSTRAGSEGTSGL
jgi:prepilin-type N-terminal cleavage/methylation domain-containing protein/prepilin-type processing-associated H-X9-DG protein